MAAVLDETKEEEEERLQQGDAKILFF